MQPPAAQPRVASRQTRSKHHSRSSLVARQALAARISLAASSQRQPSILTSAMTPRPGLSLAASASLAPRLSAHDDRLSLASASRLKKHTSTLAYLALPQPIKASSGYSRPVSRADFKFWPYSGRRIDTGHDPKGHLLQFAAREPAIRVLTVHTDDPDVRRQTALESAGPGRTQPVPLCRSRAA